MNLKTNGFASVRPLDPDDAQFVAKMRVTAAPTKGVSPTTSRQIGNSQPPVPVSNSNTSAI
jgi:hypothetical protein